MNVCLSVLYCTKQNVKLTDVNLKTLLEDLINQQKEANKGEKITKNRIGLSVVGSYGLFVSGMFDIDCS